VHRSFELTVGPQATERLIDDLTTIEGVISLSVLRGVSHKPPGDVVRAMVLNRDADQVLKAVEQCRAFGRVSISSAELDSLVDTDQSELVRTDVDEATWEDAETALRRHTRPNLNFFLTKAAGGAIASCALVSRSESTEATALVAAAIIAPSLEPLARTAMAVVLRRRDVLVEALRSVALAYAVLVVVALATMLVLRAVSHDIAFQFLHNSTVDEIRHATAVNLVISACGAVAAAVMIAAGRFTVLAGPLVALQLMPSAATIGLALELGDGTVALGGVERLAIDIGMVVVACLVVFAYKQAVTHHGRRTLR
jgi:pimeloyl-ACP methyl ester carboxylesterase